ncbi:sirohydrochlorin chelatase [Neobittarella massiliensis]|uniref:CbiX/SirB N-terminal domain-containing protein n=2 Tax=Oscillospiraceae TaxID=216572 RepID=A0A8J6LUG2_9FIRM|nr:CbiX/SirB N-terminal domain-containing protein [Neobittarella massiliensis]MBC3515700.1 CbiX/SirB N-terminal domain-containing protein [Neobittarella massiliensis]SCJ48697.1 Sirohydrochlorin cobaltochelatase [uncultured Anaerotruncus sp.]
MTGTLIVAHGSREKTTEKTFEAIIEMVRQKVTPPLESAYMEFSEKNIATGLQRLVDQGVDHVRVVPYFLFSGIHIKEDIPGEVQAFCDCHPGVTVTMGKALGEDPRIADVLAQRVAESAEL